MFMFKYLDIYATVTNWLNYRGMSNRRITSLLLSQILNCIPLLSVDYRKMITLDYGWDNNHFHYILA